MGSHHCPPIQSTRVYAKTKRKNVTMEGRESAPPPPLVVVEVVVRPSVTYSQAKTSKPRFGIFLRCIPSRKSMHAMHGAGVEFAQKGRQIFDASSPMMAWLGFPYS